MHPEIARRLIAKYAKKRTDIVFDPFMGSGGVLLEAMLHGNDAVGLDINPFAVLLSRVKTTPIEKDIRGHLSRVLKRTTEDLRRGTSYPDCMPSGYDAPSWFDPKVLATLTVLKHGISKVRDSHVRDFFMVCFSLTVRKSSYQRNGAWKIHRMAEADRAGFSPDPVRIFSSISECNMVRMGDLVRARPAGTSHPILGDSRDMPRYLGGTDGISGDWRANLVVTSPPYGDHKTTVAYGQFSRHSAHWLDLPEAEVTRVDRDGLGGRAYDGMDDLGSGTLNKTIDGIRRSDARLTRGRVPRRAGEVHAFFSDLDACLGQIAQNMAPRGGRACFVVANRTVRRITVPTDTILVELGRKYGLAADDVMFRDIPNKAMPSRNAPENITNRTGSTMTREAIIIMRC